MTGRCVCASGQKGSSVRSMKKRQAVLTGPCLRPVMDHRTRSVAISEDLDLSGIDRTLGGSVRSLPPERPVSGSRATSGLFSPFPFLSRFGGLFIRAFEFFFLDLTSAAVTHAQVAAVARAAALLRRRLLAPHLTPAPSCPCLAAPPRPPRARSRASRPGLACSAPRRSSVARLPVFTTKCSCPTLPLIGKASLVLHS